MQSLMGLSPFRKSAPQGDFNAKPFSFDAPSGGRAAGGGGPVVYFHDHGG
jgi:hypothetical protein